MNSRHPDPRRVLGRCRAAVRGQDPADPLDPRESGGSADGFIFVRFWHKKQYKLKPDFKNNNFTALFVCCCDRMFIFTVFYHEFGCRPFHNIKQKLTFGTKSLCFTSIFDAFLLKSCSGGPRRLWRSGSALGGSGRALGGPWRALGGSIYRKTLSQ